MHNIEPRMDLSKTLTIYGRKAVLEALNDTALSPQRLHLADSNKPGGIVSQIETAAKNVISQSAITTD